MSGEIDDTLNDNPPRSKKVGFWVFVQRGAMIAGICGGAILLLNYIEDHKTSSQTPTESAPHKKDVPIKKPVEVKKNIPRKTEKVRGENNDNISSVITNVVLQKCDIGNANQMPSTIRTEFKIDEIYERLQTEGTLFIKYNDGQPVLQLKRSGKKMFYDTVSCSDISVLDCDGQVSARASLILSSNVKRLLLEFSSQNTGLITEAFYSDICE